MQSFLGLANYCGRIRPNFVTIADSLRQLTKKGSPWVWTPKHQATFEQLKATLTSESVMAHYNPSALTYLHIDASPVGLRAILTQTQQGVVRPVAYASRTLNDVERHYSQTRSSGNCFGMREIPSLFVRYQVRAVYRPQTIGSDLSPQVQATC